MNPSTTQNIKTKVSRALVASIAFLFASVGVHAGGTIACAKPINIEVIQHSK